MKFYQVKQLIEVLEEKELIWVVLWNIKIISVAWNFLRKMINNY